MILKFATAALLLAMAGLTTPPNSCPSEVRILEVGEFHGDEIDAESDEKFLGLHIGDDGSILLNYQLTVEAVHDPIVDTGTDQKTGKKVSVDLPLEPLFLFDAEWINPGPVKTVFDGPDDELTQGSPITLKLGDTSYELKVVSESGEKCEPTGGLPKNAQLVLTSGKISQTLYALEECGSDPFWALLWAGDLDGDGKLDLYVNVSQHYNVSERRLYLSGSASEEFLVEDEGQLITTGC